MIPSSRSPRRCGWLVLVLLPAACSWLACGDDDPMRPPPSSQSTLAIVLNGLGETLSTLDIDSGELVNDAVAVGAVPNHIALTPDARSALVTASGGNRVDVVCLETFRVLRSIDLGPGANPYEAVPVDGRTAYVSEWLTHQVTRIDWQTGTVITRIPVGPSPEGVAVHDGRVFVACTGYAHDPTFTARGEVAVIEADTVLASLTVGRNPQFVLAVGDEIHVVCSGRYGALEGQVMIIDPAVPALVDSIAIGGTPAFAAALDDVVYVSGYYGGLLEYDWRTRTILRGVENPVLPLEGLYGLAVDHDSSRLYVTVFPDDLLLALAADTLVAQWVVGDGPQRVVVRPGDGGGG
jgi:YVTN family beta-propeller protein